MGDYFKKRWVLLLILTALVVIKAPVLHYAYYWDESWPYAPAFKYVYQHGVSLLPNAVDLNYSHGHPPMFYALGGLWMKVFGSSNVALHSFALAISLLLLIVVYETALRFAGHRAAILATLLLAVQEAFIVQSMMLLPEILVALLCFLSIVLYTREKYILCAISLCLLALTKESGLVAPMVLGIDAGISLLNKKLTIRAKISRLLAVGIPCSLFGAYLLLQKNMMGWYFYPGHTDLVHHDLQTVWSIFKPINGILFLWQNKNWYFITLIILAIAAAIRTRRYKLLLLLPPAICIFYFVGDQRADRAIPFPYFFYIFVVCCIAFMYAYQREFSSPTKKRLFLLTHCFVLAYMIFSAFNFFTPRYTLTALVPLLFWTGVLMDDFINKLDKRLFYPVLVSIPIIGAISYKQNTTFGDCAHHSLEALYVEQEIVKYFEHNVPRDKNISTACFLEEVHLNDPNTGFLENGPGYKTSSQITDTTDYAIFIVIQEDNRINDIRKSADYALVKRIDKGYAWAEIYKHSRKLQSKQ